jgi:excisionase family DNA binding protein
VVFRKRGILALLDAGIAKYSWKTVRWLRRLSEARRERAKYLTTGQAARMLDLSVDTVKKLLKSRGMEYFRGKGYSTRHYILTADVQKLKEKLLEKRGKMRALESKGMELKEVSKSTRIPYSTLHNMCKNGKLQATLTCLIGQGRRWIIPRHVVEKLKQAGTDRLRKSHENETLSKMMTET